jgi:hypothetical protein
MTEVTGMNARRARASARCRDVLRSIGSKTSARLEWQWQMQKGYQTQQCLYILRILVSGTFKGLEEEVILTFRVFLFVGTKAQIECGLPYA